MDSSSRTNSPAQASPLVQQSPGIQATTSQRLLALLKQQQQQPVKKQPEADTLPPVTGSLVHNLQYSWQTFQQDQHSSMQQPPDHSDNDSNSPGVDVRAVITPTAHSTGPAQGKAAPSATMSKLPAAHPASSCGPTCAGGPLQSSTAPQDLLLTPLSGPDALDLLALLAARRPAGASAHQPQLSSGPRGADLITGRMDMPIPASFLQLSSPTFQLSPDTRAGQHNSSLAVPAQVSTAQQPNSTSRPSSAGSACSCAVPRAATPPAWASCSAQPSDAGTHLQHGAATPSAFSSPTALAPEGSASTIRDLLLRNLAALQPLPQQLPCNGLDTLGIAAGSASAAAVHPGAADPAAQPLQVPPAWQAPQPQSPLHGVALPMTGSTAGNYLQDNTSWGPAGQHMFGMGHPSLGAGPTGAQQLSAFTPAGTAPKGQPLWSLTSHLAQQQQDLQAAAAAAAHRNPRLTVPSQLSSSAHDALPSYPVVHEPAVYAAAHQQQQQQLDELLRAQQLQGLQAQAQLQSGCAAGGLGLIPGAFGAVNSLGLSSWNPGTLQGAALPGFLGGPVHPALMHPALMHPAMQLQQQQQQLLLMSALHQQQQQQLLAAQSSMHPCAAGMVFNSTGSVTAVVPGPMPAVTGAADGAAFASAQPAARQALGTVSPFAAAQGHTAAEAEPDSSTWLLRWMPLPQRSNSHTAHPAPPATGGFSSHASALMTPAATTMAAAAATELVPAATGGFALTAFNPISAAVGIGSLLLRGSLFVGNTAASATARTAHSAALACISVSQFQLLLLLCCLTVAAAAARAAAMAAAALVDAGCVAVQLAGRESRMFARAAALVAFTDLKQLCKLLATQAPLLLTHSKAAPHTQITSSTGDLQLMTGAATYALEAAAAAAPLAVAPSSSLRRRLSAVLGDLLMGTASSRRITVTGASRRTSTCTDAGTAAVNSTVPIASSLSPAATAAVAAAAAAHLPVFPQAVSVCGLSPHTLILYDSLAVVSGLWAGMWLRLWMLLALHAPLASTRIWLHAVHTSCVMSATAAAASARTGMHAAWALAQLSLMLLGAAANTSGSNSSNQATAAPVMAVGSGGQAPAAAAPGWAPLPGGVLMAVYATVQWAFLQAAKAQSSLWQLAGPTLLWWLPGGAAALQLLSSISAFAGSAVVAAAATVCSALSSVTALGGQLSFKAGMRGFAAQALQLAGLLSLWLACRAYSLLEALACVGVEWLLRDAPPVAHAAVYGSSRMIKGLVIEAARQSGLLAVQLLHAWQATGAAE